MTVSRTNRAGVRQYLSRESIGLCCICGRNLTKFATTELEGGYRFLIGSECHGEQEVLDLSKDQIRRTVRGGLFPPFLATATRRKLKSWHLLTPEGRERRTALVELCDGAANLLDGQVEAAARRSMAEAALLLRRRVKLEKLRLSQDELDRRRRDIEALKGPQPNFPSTTRREAESEEIGRILANRAAERAERVASALADEPPPPPEQPRNDEPPPDYAPGRRRIVVDS